MPVLVDSNVLLDVLTEDPRWSSWSMRALAEQGDRDVLAINPVIYAEVSIGFVPTASAVGSECRRRPTSTSVRTPACRA